jgi:hypothetical protein
MFSQAAKLFDQNNRKLYKIVQGHHWGRFFLPITHYGSPLTKRKSYIITFSTDLLWIVTSYLHIKCTKPSPCSLHR